MCSSKDQSFHKGTIYMVPRPNLGDGSVYTFCSVHPRLRCTSFDETTPCCVCNGVGTLMPTVETPLRIEKFNSNVFHFLNLTKAFSIWFCTHSLGSFVPFAMIGD